MSAVRSAIRGRSGVDNGTEFISREVDLRAYATNVTLDFSRPGKSTDNGFFETFNSKLRAECLNAHWVMDLADARKKLEDCLISRTKCNTLLGCCRYGKKIPTPRS